MRKLRCFCGKFYDADKSLRNSLVGYCSVVCKETAIKKNKKFRNNLSKKYKNNKYDIDKNKIIKIETIKFENKNKKSAIFYSSKEWLDLRYDVLLENGRVCMMCGARAPIVEIHVDHIKPRSKFPHLELDKNNLQVLCSSCNKGKGSRDQTDFRNK